MATLLVILISTNKRERDHLRYEFPMSLDR